MPNSLRIPDTVKMGPDPNLWFNNVEPGVARVIGGETVRYIKNIDKDCLACLLVVEQPTHRLQNDSVSTP